MFAKTIVLSDAFLDMPMSARCLYFTLGMVADDDGFVNSPRSIMRQIGASDDDIKVLISKRYVLIFESGVIVIKHWRMNNYLQKDRHKPTSYQEELSTLTLDKKGAYTELENAPEVQCIQNVYTGKDSIGKDSIDKSSIGEDSKGECEGEPASCLPEKKRFGKFVELTQNEFATLLSEYGTIEFQRRKDAVDLPENEGKDFVELIRCVF